MITIIEPSLQGTVQDLGRFGFEHLGVSPAGAIDKMALVLGNRLVGNNENAAALEFSFSGAELTFDRELIFSITGCDCLPLLNGEPIELWRPYQSTPGSILRFQGPQTGARYYLCIAGGLEIPTILTSRSTHLLGAFGGLNGRSLKKGDRIQTNSTNWENEQFEHQVMIDEGISAGKIANIRKPSEEIRVLAGPEFESFSPMERNQFFEKQQRVSNVLNRSGIRIETGIGEQAEREIRTRGVDLGSIQIPSNGKPIVLLNDQQTTGGYPVIAVVISADLWRLAQITSKSKIQWRLVELEEAWEAEAQQERALFMLYQDIIMV